MDVTVRTLPRNLQLPCQRLTIRAEDVEAADEWFEGHAELAAQPASTLPASQNSLPEAGRQPADALPASSPAGSTPAASSPPASNPPATTLNETANSQPADDVATSSPQATPAPTQPAMTLQIPPGVQPTPIAAIDLFIRKGYVSRDTLGEIMKHNFHGKAYRKEVVQRLALYNARQPPFNDIPTGTVVSGVDVAGNVAAEAGVNPENTRVSVPTPAPSSQQPLGTPSASNQSPDPFVASRSLPDAEALQSVKNTLGPWRSPQTLAVQFVWRTSYRRES